MSGTKQASVDQFTLEPQCCWTDTDHERLVPLEANIGDLLVIFPGGKTPYILRPIGSECSEFVGEWYLL